MDLPEERSKMQELVKKLRLKRDVNITIPDYSQMSDGRKEDTERVRVESMRDMTEKIVGQTQQKIKKTQKVKLTSY